MSQSPVRETGMSLLERLPEDLFNLIAAAGSVGTKRGERVYLVGGFVRDLVLDVPNLDIDLVVEGDAVKLAKAMQRRFEGVVLAHERFKTATWMVDPAHFPEADGLQALRSIDFISARRESYAAPGALPDIALSTIADDLARRDFSINTLAIALGEPRLGELLDPFDALRDLRARNIRALHERSFMDDPTRILRAARYEQRFAFHIDPHTEALIGPALPLLAKISGERIWHELDRIGGEGLPEKALRRLESLGVLHAIDPALRLSESLDADFDKLRDALGVPEPLVYLAAWLARLPAENTPGLMHRLHLASEQRRLIVQLQGALALEAEVGGAAFRPSAIVRLLEPFDERALRIAQVLSVSELAQERIAHYRTHWREIEPLLDGKRLQELGIVPGPVYRQILAAVREAHLDAQISTRDQAEQMAMAIANNRSQETSMTLPEVEGYIETLRDLREETLKHVGALEAEALNWKPPVSDTNSIYALATHMAGSERYWIQKNVGGVEVKRDRPAEFAASGADVNALRQQIHEVAQQSEAVLRSLSAADLRSMRKTTLGEHSVQWCILHVVEHLSRHLGHVELTRQLWEAQAGRGKSVRE